MADAAQAHAAAVVVDGLEKASTDIDEGMVDRHGTDYLKKVLAIKTDEGNITDGPDSAARAAAVANMPAAAAAPTAAAATAADDDHDDDAADDVEPPPAGIDEEAWRALPTKLRAEHAEVSAEQLEASEHT